MNRKIFSVVCVVLLLITACRRESAPIVTAIPPAAPSIDCTYDNTGCPQLEIPNDEPYRFPNGQEAHFSGFADPTLRADPKTGTLWLAYSYPGIHLVDSHTLVPTVDIHLAHSDDGGNNWNFDGILWASHEDTNKGGNGEPGFTDHEVANLLPIETGSGVRWVAARLEYFVPNDGGYKSRPFDSFRLQIMQAASPKELATAIPATFSTFQTAPEWGIDTDLGKLHSDVSQCDMWNEPALFYENSQLYLAIRCLTFSNLGIPQLEKSPIVVFATTPTEDVQTWQWRYVGQLAGAEIGRELGAEAVTQIDIAKSKDGKLLLILTPEGWSSAEKDFIHYGTRVLEIASIDPPMLARDLNENLIIHAVITASDQMPLGNGAATYDPSSFTGIIFTGRLKTQNSLIATLHATGLMP